MKQEKNVIQAFRHLSKGKKRITLVDGAKNRKTITYQDLWNRGFALKEELSKKGIGPGREIIILCKENETFLCAFWAGIFGKNIAIPVDVSNDLKQDIQLNSILKLVREPVIITDTDKELWSDFAGGEVFFMEEYFEQLPNSKDYTGEHVDLKPDDIMYIQYSSGSSGKMHGAQISMENVTQSTIALIKHCGFRENDRFLSLSPLTHCLGLVGFHFAPIMAGAEQCIFSTSLYMNQPLFWAKMIEQYKATVLSSLPFAMKHFSTVFQNTKKEKRWDLSSVRSMLIGGEQLNSGVCEEFLECVSPLGMETGNLMPVYGLSEATVIVSSKKAGDSLKMLHIAGRYLEIGTKADCCLKEFADRDEPGEDKNEYMSMGALLDCVKVSIRDEENNELEEGTPGYIYISGPCVTKGYYKDNKETEEMFTEDNWFNTGDVGILYEGELIIVGREKELVVANGRKVACVLLEETVQQVIKDSPYKQCVVSNGVSQRSENEKVVVFIKTENELESLEELQKFAELKMKIGAVVYEKNGITVGAVVPVDEIPRTSSGKVFRRKLSEDYNLGIYREKEMKLRELDINGQKTKEKKYTREKIEEEIVTYMEQNFHVQITDLDKPIFQYGIVSVNIPPFVEMLREHFQVEISAGDIFTYFTVRKLSEHILNCKKEEVHKSVIEETDRNEVEDKIAIIGMGCRFPGGANSIEEFWDLLSSGKDGISEVPADRWDVEKYYDADRQAPGKTCNKKAGYLDCGIDGFDARFFNISPKEAKALDPQQRILLEVTWEAFENANLNIEHYNGSNTGVYVGICANEYYMSQTQSGDLKDINPYSLTGCSWSTACGRISYTFGFEGPCASVDTACSSALTALHFACTALKEGEADMQVVAGVNLIESPTNTIGFSKLQATCPDGYCKSFDAAANGYARGEGCGVLLLKRLSDAIRDDNEILAVVRGTAVNQDGKSNGLTAPNGESQEKLIRKTMNAAGVKADEIDYVEMHGTGTKLGDPIEVNAVAATYGRGREAGNLLKIGSVKSNIGHLESAAGTASIIKVLLAMKHHMIPANLHFHTPNPLINWQDSNIEVVARNAVWEKENGLRMAAVNGFGFGGSNAHVILEEFQKKPKIKSKSMQKGMDYILKITAQSEESLDKLIQAYVRLLENAQDDEMTDIVQTASQGRTDLAYRFLVVGKDRTSILKRMEEYLKNGYANGVICNRNQELKKERKAVFLFTGQGSQYVNMGKMLYETNEVFRDAMDECDRLFHPYLLCSILELVYGLDAKEEQVQRTVYAQPLIFAIEYSLAMMWKELGVEPEIVMGHSIGEYAAAVSGGIITLQDAVKLVSARGRLMDMAPGRGKMASVFADEEMVHELLTGYENTVCIAAKNAAENHVISGAAEDVEVIVEKAIAKGYRAKELVVSHAFHSMLMEPVMKEFYQVAKGVVYHQPGVRFVSSLYGRELEPDETLDADYWTKHIRAEVDFYKALNSIDEKQNYLFLEIGANRVLSALAKLIFGGSQLVASSLSMKENDEDYLPQQIAAVYASGMNIRWNQVVYAGKKYWEKVTLPNYPYNKKRYWMELKYDRSALPAVQIDYHPVLGQRIDVSTGTEAVIYQSRFSTKQPYFMSEHVIFDVSISPAAAHTSMLLSAMEDMCNLLSCTLEHLEFRAPLAIKGEEERQVQIYLEQENQQEFSISSRDFTNKKDKWLLHAKGNARANDQYLNTDKQVDISQFENLFFQENIEETVYDYMRSTGFWLGDGFRCIKKFHKEENECVCLLEPLTTVPDYQEFIIYPGVIDSIFQSGLVLILEQLIKVSEKEAVNKTIIPYYVEKIAFNYYKAEKLWCHTKSEYKNNVIYVDIMVYNELGQVVMKIDRMLIKLTNSKSLLREMASLDKYYYHTTWKLDSSYAKERSDLGDVKTILFGDEEDMVDALADKLEQHGADVVKVDAIKHVNGSAFERINDTCFAINPEEKGDWSELFKTLSREGADNGFQIIYGNFYDSISLESQEAVPYTEVKVFYHLLEVITKGGYLRNTKVQILTKQVQNLSDGEDVNLAGSLLWGFAKTLSLEYPEIYAGIVDIDEAALENDAFIASLLGTELEERAVRGQERYEARLVTHKDFMKKHASEQRISVRADASYLITGGTGALGMAYIKQLMKEGARNFILVSRHEPDALVQDELQELRKQGASICTVCGDVSQFESLKEALQEASTQMPPVKGVVDAAGVLHDKMLTELDWEGFRSVLEPKVAGAIHLYRLLKDSNLDFFMMLSSITSVVGNMGQANYGSANYFFNRFASCLRKQGIPAYTFCWGPWGKSGMAANSEAVTKSLKRMGLTPIDREIAQAMIEEFIKAPYETMLLAEVDWDTLHASMKQAPGKTAFLSELLTRKQDTSSGERENTKASVKETLATLSEQEKKEYLCVHLQDEFGRIMGFGKGQLSIGEGLSEQGADSLMMFSMNAAVNQMLDLNMTVSVFFEYPTIEKLVEYLIKEMK